MPRYISESDIYGLFDQSGRASLHVADIDVLPRAECGAKMEERVDHVDE